MGKSNHSILWPLVGGACLLLALTLTGAGGGQRARLTISLPRVKYRTVGLPISAGDFLTQDVECTVLKPSGSAIASVTLTNHESSLA